MKHMEKKRTLVTVETIKVTTIRLRGPMRSQIFCERCGSDLKANVERMETPLAGDERNTDGSLLESGSDDQIFKINTAA